MNTTKLLLGCMFMLALSLVIWSCKDDFSAEDQLRLQAELDEQARLNALSGQDSIALAIQVYNASTSTHSVGGRTSGTKGLSGITVALSAQGSILTRTTDAEGIANFFVQPGTVAGTLTGTGFATANFVLSVNEDEDAFEEKPGEILSNAAVILPVFANTGPSVATVTGNLTFEGNLLNDTREPVPDGTSITFVPTPSTLQAYYNSIASRTGDVDAYSMEGTFTATTTGGTYTATLPTGANGLTYQAIFSDIVADQTLAINNLSNDPVFGSVRDIRTFPTRFGPGVSLTSDEFDDIPLLDATQVDVAAPPAAGTGAAITVRLTPQGAGGTLGTFAVINGGSGYGASLDNVPVTVTGGSFDAAVTGQAPAVLFASTNANGAITDIQTFGGVGGTLGFGYRSQPGVSVGGAGTGAIVRSNYQSTVQSSAANITSSGSVITSGGTGYLQDVPPTITITGFGNTGDQITGTIGATVSNGAVVAVGASGTQFASITSAIVVPATRTQALAGVNVNNLGEISSTFNNGTGNGYSPGASPAVTVRVLRGTGTGAVINALVVDNNITTYALVNRGSGYLDLEANFPDFQIGFSGSLNQVLHAGKTVVLDAYYGTGVRSQGVE